MRSTTTGEVTLSERQRDLLRVLRVDDNLAVFSSDERIPDWAALKKVMVALGGKWNRKGFAFPEDVDAAELVRVAIEAGRIIDPMAADFYPTPAWLAERLVESAKIAQGDHVLEPSAGRGAIALMAQAAGGIVLCVERLEANVAVLRAEGLAVREGDFLAMTRKQLGPQHAIVMNPPFSRRADIAHVTHAMGFLRKGGRLAAIMSASVTYRDDAKGTAFRELVRENRGTIEPLPEWAFKEAGTAVRTVMVSMRKFSGI